MRLASEFEPGWRGRGWIDIFGKSEHLKGAAEHLGMQQRLERALRRAIGLQEIRPSGDDAGKEMMLISESGDGESVCLRATSNARPIDVHRNVCVTDLFKGRVEMSMLGADLNIALRIIARVPVVDDDRVPSLQVRSQAIDPIERSLIKHHV